MSILSTFDRRLEELMRRYSGPEWKREFNRQKDLLLQERDREIELRTASIRNGLIPRCEPIRVKSGKRDTLEILASTWATGPDTKCSMFERGACLNLSTFSQGGPVLLEHRRACEPLAEAIDARESSAGPVITARWKRSRWAQDWRTTLRERARAGKSIGASIGCDLMPETVRTEWIGGRPVKVIGKYLLEEVSLSRYPANGLARVVSI